MAIDASVTVSNLTKRFGHLVAVDSISLSVNQGEVLGFLGPNGAGKSTTMKMITGYLNATSGVVEIGGKKLSSMNSALKKNIGYVPEGAPAYGEMTPLSYLKFIAEIRSIGKKERKNRVEEIMTLMNLNEVATRRIETLSKGYKRRVGLAQAIIHDPNILIMDEPTDGLDPNQKHEIRSLIRSMAPKKAIIISTHILEEIDSVCTKIAIINSGKIIFTGTPRQLANESKLNNALTVVVSQEMLEPLKEFLLNTPQVAELKEVYQGNSVRVTAVMENKSYVDKDILKKLIDSNIHPSEYFLEKGRLDQVFRRLTDEKET